MSGVDPNAVGLIRMSGVDSNAEDSKHAQPGDCGWPHRLPGLSIARRPMSLLGGHLGAYSPSPPLHSWPWDN
jgi:hypothetical protein